MEIKAFDEDFWSLQENFIAEQLLQNSLAEHLLVEHLSMSASIK